MRDRAWYSRTARGAWLATVLTLLFGGGFAWYSLGALCEDTGPGTDGFCGRGWSGWPVSGLVFAGLLVAALLVPVVAVLTKHKRLFWSGLVGPLALAFLNVFLSWTLGQA